MIITSVFIRRYAAPFALAVLASAVCLISCSKKEDEDTAPVTEYWRGEADIDLDVGTVGDNWTDQVQMTIREDVYTLFFLSGNGNPPLCDAEGNISSLYANTATLTPTTYFADGGCRSHRGPQGQFSVVFSAGNDSLTLESIGGADLFRFRLARFTPPSPSPTAP